MPHKQKNMAWTQVPTNQIFNGDCVKGMARLPEASIPLVVTSPPYDKIFIYDGRKWNFDVFKNVAEQLWRILMPGGIICWQIKDQCINGIVTCTMYKHLLHFTEQLGFRLHEKIYVKHCGQRPKHNRYSASLQEVFVFSKGEPKTINRIRDRLNITAGSPQKVNGRDKHGVSTSWDSGDLVPILGFRSHLWEIKARTKDNLKGFPAAMPEQLAKDLIRTYSKAGDLVLDPFSGSGTTAKMAMLEHRDYLGFEVWKKHYYNSLKRLQRAKKEYQQKLDRILACSESEHEEKRA